MQVKINPMITREFYPVGQGAFYVERCGNFSMVYDCGSIENGLIKKRVKNAFVKDKDVDAVFISHLHKDHVNGLEHLLKYCNVKKMFLPLLSSEERLLLLIYNSYTTGKYNKNGFLERLITKSEREINGAQVIRVSSESQTNSNEIDEININNYSYNEIKSGVKLKLQEGINWIFVLFNFQRKGRSLILKKELRKIGINKISNVADFERLWKTKEGQSSIKKAYENVCGKKKFNTNSMTLYSGPNTDDHRMLLCSRRTDQYSCLLTNRPACLYLGDYKAKGRSGEWEELYNNYKICWHRIGTVQIPHHGSYDNYNKKINKEPMISIISANEKDKHHPHREVLEHIASTGYPVIVNKKDKTMTQQIIEDYCIIF